MHKGIIKENQLRRECFIEAHIFPSLNMDAAIEMVRCSSSGFQRITDEETFDELNDNNRRVPGSKSRHEREIETAEKMAFEKGYQQGLMDGIANGKKEVEPVLMKFKQALSELELLRRNIAVLAEKEAVDLSMAIARKIVGNEISINKNVICHVVKEALKKVNGHEDIKIRLNPVEQQIVIEAKEELKNIASCVKDIEIISDENIAPGGCVIETDIGDIDARIEKQLKVVEDAFHMESR